MYLLELCLYTLLMTLALPLFIVRLFWKSFNLQPYRERIAERLGIYKNLKPKPGGFLIHAVSLGEVVLTTPVVKALKTQYPECDITVTATTPTGSARVKQSYGDTVAHAYMPFDLPWAINNLLNKVKPRCLIIMETEIWPYLIILCKLRRIPVFIVNGRISDVAIKRYLWVRFFIAKILPQVTFVTAQSELDAQRFIQLGLPAQKIRVTGNLKFDAQVNEAQLQLGKQLKAQLGDRIVWVAASTHPGEEEQVLQAFAQVQQHVPNCLLILIPRHPDRFNAVADLLTAQNLKFTRRSANQNCAPETAILLGDTMGEMGVYYAMADVAYVGGSLVPIGGHNLLEPSVLGVPSLTGPHYHNFKDITLMLHKAKATVIVQNADELAHTVLQLLQAPELRAQQGTNALQVVMQNRGAVQSVLDVVAQTAKI